MKKLLPLIALAVFSVATTFGQVVIPPGTSLNITNVASTPSGGTPAFGPGSSTNNAWALWDGTGGNLLKNSDVTYSSPTLSVPASFVLSGAGTVAVNTSSALSLTLSGGAAAALTGGAGNMTIVAGTGNSRTLALQTTTSGGVATTAFLLNATQSGILAGNLTFGTAGSILSGTTGSQGITVTGTNQSWTTSLSGNAPFVVTSPNNAASLRILQLLQPSMPSGGGAGTSLSFLIGTADTTNNGVYFGFNNAGGAGSAANYFEMGMRGVAPTFILTGSGHTLLGGLTTDGTGVLQFPAHTTSAGGITMGASLNLYSQAVGNFEINAPSATTSLVSFALNGTRSSQMGTSGGNTFMAGVGNMVFATGSFAGTTGLTISSAQLIRFNAYGAGAITSDSSGNLTSVSDERAKDTIGDFKKGLAEIRKLTPKSYHWKKESGLNTNDLNVSVYAQDLIAAGLGEAVFTQRTVADMETVTEKAEKDFDTGAKDADGKAVLEKRMVDQLVERQKTLNGEPVTKMVDATYYTVSDRAVISALINAVKELADKNDSLTAEVVALKAR